jgi:cysteine desulfurase/selenocysteine lyase
MIPVTLDGRIDLDALPRLLTPKTKLISLAHVSNVTGALLDVRAVVEARKAVGAKVMLDGAQRAPHGPLDLPRSASISTSSPATRPTAQRRRRAVGQARAARAMPPFHGGGSMIGR